ncbi:MAG: tetratricopeptide repeat protein [Candidatus Eisenbacteria bacterium]|uniref:Tetratricopeptide repeat protein n=1 Tax=Eiseniibacteriota bacterium TaxID=2212470 RepID=A0A956RPD7_UNCEI|nr:tetratricopeptide repeat protein [Candidatus Eisenbacteria bacterium]
MAVSGVAVSAAAELSSSDRGVQDNGNDGDAVPDVPVDGGPGSGVVAEPADRLDFDALWDYDHPAETEARFRELLAQSDPTEESYRLQLETQIARSLGLQQLFSEAHEVLDEVDRAVATSPADLRLVRVRSLLERGRAFNSAGSADQARVPFERAWDLAREIGADGYAVDAAHMMAIVETGEDAVPWFERGVALAEASTDSTARRWLGPLYNNLGWTFHDAGDYDRALVVFERSLAWREARKDTVETRIAKWCVGRCLRSLGRLDEALSLQRALSRELEAAGAEDGYVDEELGECLLALGRPAEAAPRFARAYVLLSQDLWLVRDEPARLARLRELSGVAADSTRPHLGAPH